jgi:hypothetical protein
MKFKFKKLRDIPNAIKKVKGHGLKNPYYLVAHTFTIWEIMGAFAKECSKNEVLFNALTMNKTNIYGLKLIPYDCLEEGVFLIIEKNGLKKERDIIIKKERDIIIKKESLFSKIKGVLFKK